MSELIEVCWLTHPGYELMLPILIIEHETNTLEDIAAAIWNKPCASPRIEHLALKESMIVNIRLRVSASMPENCKNRSLMKRSAGLWRGNSSI